MEKAEFYYKRKPAIISSLPVYIICFGVSYWLINNSPAISKEINRYVVAYTPLQYAKYAKHLLNLPYGKIFSLFFLFYGIRTLLWNLMSSYEMGTSEIRMLTGYISRKEQFFSLLDFYEVSFKQNLIETPFRVGTLILNRRRGGQLIIKGVYGIRSVAESLRKCIPP
jgi:hypothetical protein